MAAPIVYRWDDGNAPVARGERTSLIEILRACLVDGYGTKPAAGWTLEYINATLDKAAFRNNPVTGTGFYFQVDGLGGANDYSPKVMGYETMTSESDGLFPFYITVRDIAISNGANTTARPWILIADDRAFYFVVWGSITTTPIKTNYNVNALFFGDCIAFDQNDLFFCGLCAAANLYGSYGKLGPPAGHYGNANVNVATPRAASGASGSIICDLIYGGGPGSTSSVGAHGAAYSPGDPIFIARPYLDNGVAYTFRGFLPGFYYPCHDKPFDQFEELEIDGKQYLSLTHFVNYSSGMGCYLISLDDWRA